MSAASDSFARQTKPILNTSLFLTCTPALRHFFLRAAMCKYSFSGIVKLSRTIFGFLRLSFFLDFSSLSILLLQIRPAVVLHKMRRLFIDDHAANRIFYHITDVRHLPVLIRAATLRLRLELSIGMLMMMSVVFISSLRMIMFGVFLHMYSLSVGRTCRLDRSRS